MQSLLYTYMSDYNIVLLAVLFSAAVVIPLCIEFVITVNKSDRRSICIVVIAILFVISLKISEIYS